MVTEIGVQDQTRPGTDSGDSSPPAQQLGALEKVVAVALLVALVAFIVALVFLRRDPSWDRLVFLFSGFEAIVFAAAGALFGTRIQRGTVQLAQRRAEDAVEQAGAARVQVTDERARTAKAREDAEAAQVWARQAQTESQRHAVEAQAGRGLAAAVKAELGSQTAETDAQRRGGRESPAAVARDPGMARVAAY